MRMAPWTPLWHRSRPGRKRDLDRNSGDLPFWTFLAAPGRSKGAFWTPGGSRKCPKIDMGRLGRHLGGQEGPKSSSREGSRNGSEKVIKKGSKMRAFGRAKTSKSVVRSLKIEVLRGLEKYQKMTEKGSQNLSQKYQKWSPWLPWGGQGATLSPPLVDLRGPENRSIFEGSLGRQKVDGC